MSVQKDIQYFEQAQCTTVPAEPKSGKQVTNTWSCVDRESDHARVTSVVTRGRHGWAGTEDRADSNAENSESTEAGLSLMLHKTIVNNGLSTNNNTCRKVTQEPEPHSRGRDSSKTDSKGQTPSTSAQKFLSSSQGPSESGTSFRHVTVAHQKPGSVQCCSTST